MRVQLAFQEVQFGLHRRLPPVEPHFEKLHRQCDPHENIRLLKRTNQVGRFGELLFKRPFQLPPNERRVILFHRIIDNRVGDEYFHQPESQRGTDDDQQKEQYELHVFLAIEIPRNDHVGDQVKIADVYGHEQSHNADREPVIGHTRTVNDRQDRQYGEPEQNVQ